MAKQPETDSEKFLHGLLRVSRVEQDRSLSPTIRQALSYIPQSTNYCLPDPNAHLLSSEKAILTRKANELFRLGQVAAAEKIYLAVGYSAGLNKLADYYLQRNDFIRAYLFLRAANDEQRANTTAQRFVAVVRKWLKN